MKKVLTLMLATACFMIPIQAIAETDSINQEIITDYVSKICSITN